MATKKKITPLSLKAGRKAVASYYANKQPEDLKVLPIQETLFAMKVVCGMLDDERKVDERLWKFTKKK